MDLDALLDAIADRVAARLVARLERAATPVVYTTHKAGPHIPRRSRRWMLEHVKSMPGARKIGREWTISAADYDAWVTAEDARRCVLAGKPKMPRVVKSKVTTQPSNDISYDADEAELGLRAVRSLQAQGLRRSK